MHVSTLVSRLRSKWRETFSLLFSFDWINSSCFPLFSFYWLYILYSFMDISSPARLIAQAAGTHIDSILCLLTTQKFEFYLNEFVRHRYRHLWLNLYIFFYFYHLSASNQMENSLFVLSFELNFLGVELTVRREKKGRIRAWQRIQFSSNLNISRAMSLCACQYLHWLNDSMIVSLCDEIFSAIFDTRWGTILKFKLFESCVRLMRVRCALHEEFALSRSLCRIFSILNLVTSNANACQQPHTGGENGGFDIQIENGKWRRRENEHLYRYWICARICTRLLCR